MRARVLCHIVDNDRNRYLITELLSNAIAHMDLDDAIDAFKMLGISFIDIHRVKEGEREEFESRVESHNYEIYVQMRDDHEDYEWMLFWRDKAPDSLRVNRQAIKNIGVVNEKNSV